MAPMSGGLQAVLLPLAGFCCLAAMSWVSADSPLVSVCPRENALLRCLFTVDTPEENATQMPPVNLKHLVVVWKHGNKNVLTFKNTVIAYRLGGARLDMKELAFGNASMTLPHVETADCGEYVCEISYSGEKQKVYRILHIDDTKNCDYKRVKRQVLRSHRAVSEEARVRVIIVLFIWLFSVAITSIMLWCKGSLD